LQAYLATGIPPPFPTRRSSDLAGALARDHLSRLREKHRLSRTLPKMRWEQLDPGRSFGRHLRADEGAALADDDRGRRRHRIVSTDRKSTRLNSSHQIISYAVFC